MKPDAQSIVLLDGGLGQEIYRRAKDISSPLWSVAVMLEKPEIVTAVHADFIRAGARTLTLNTYTATPDRLRKNGALSQMGAIHHQAFEALERAMEATGTEVDVAGCLPPLFGSYRGQPERSFEDLRGEYATLVELQQRADVMLIETMTNTLEARAACDAARELGKPFAVSFRLEANGGLKSGESLAKAVSTAAHYAPTAVMLNCCDLETLTTAMPELVALYPRVGGYANAFESVESVANGGLVDTLEAREDVSPATYGAAVEQWLNNGAVVTGGCCEITPAHIRYLADSFNNQCEIIGLSQLGARP
ncbi:homocysteine S-methyltransferase family protein [Chromatocurvus halotolerans]|uniref:Homocysteine S-methyltransferase n=1 Tax=Chromatocurvus halotolerans TaxID=1132028 RepID=A0A4R2KT03_9GAMM|nr:homocysteine S-methyltransferase family protein [Chromatocurvus halotolerans]TCO75887.1 homocysteine S-methyltransferase [Chromatocurvus halotolerans]